jgi:TM2 domain-containing membrane protein YozV
MKQQDDTIYDLGEVELDKPRPVFGANAAAPRPTPIRRTASPATAPAGVGPGLAGSLSMFVPGLGQMIVGEIAWGLFYLTGIGFCAATLWAVLGTLDRVVPMLRLLDVPLEVLFVAIGSLAGFAIVLHLAAIVHAQRLTTDISLHAAPHPIVAGLASLIIPGWGQLLAGHRRRAALFLGGVWFSGVAWLLVTPAGTHLLSRLGLRLPAAMRDGWGPVVMLAAPIVMWVIAVYDGAAGAASERTH